jgi:hypothetical protein
MEQRLASEAPRAQEPEKASNAKRPRRRKAPGPLDLETGACPSRAGPVRAQPRDLKMRTCSLKSLALA